MQNHRLGIQSDKIWADSTTKNTTTYLTTYSTNLPNRRKYLGYLKKGLYWVSVVRNHKEVCVKSVAFIFGQIFFCHCTLLLLSFAFNKLHKHLHNSLVKTFFFSKIKSLKSFWKLHFFWNKLKTWLLLTFSKFTKYFLIFQSSKIKKLHWNSKFDFKMELVTLYSGSNKFLFS